MTTTLIGQRASRGMVPALVMLIVGLVLGFMMADLYFVLARPPLSEWLSKGMKYQQKLIYKPAEFAKHVHTYKNTTMAEKLYKEVRVLCWIMTSPDNHELRARHVKETWGKRCNKLIFMSSVEDKNLGAVGLPIDEGRENLWGKTKEAFKYIYKHHMNDADWFLKADDDTYTIVENLRYMLYPYTPETPIYFGCKFQPYINQGYMSGGAGYVLSKEAVRRFVTEAIPQPRLCREENDGAEDIEIGECLQSVKVIAGDSRDSYGLGKFFPLVPEQHVIPNNTVDWYWTFNFYKNNITNSGCCSDDTISFHYVTPVEMHTLEFLIYHLQPYGIVRTPEPLPKKIPIIEEIFSKIKLSNKSTF